MLRLSLLCAVLLAMPTAIQAQDDDAAAVGDVVEVTATIQAIDTEDRLITLEGEDGDLVTIYAGPEVKRFDELKVGDEVTFTYAEAVVVEISEAHAGDAPSVDAVIVAGRGAGERPSGGVARQVTATVRVKTLDPDEGSLTVEMPDGGTQVFDLEDPEVLEGIEVDELVSLTYTQALLISVE